MDDTEISDLAAELSEELNEFVGVDHVQQHTRDGASLVICDLRYTRGSTNRRVAHTAVVLRAENLDLPQFTLHPQISGILGAVISGVGASIAINFDDSPEFSAAYRVQAWNEQAVRLLFNTELREHMSQHHGWTVRGHGNRLVLFRFDQLCPENDREEFLQEALQILGFLQKGEQQLDARPDIRRDVTANDMLESADQMGGIVGAMLRAQLEKIAIRPEELSGFLNSSVPRTIPAGMKRQVLGDNLPLLFLGPVFVLVGLGVGGGLLMFLDHDRWLGGVLLVMFVLAGLLMFGLTFRHRRRKSRVLANGVLTAGRIAGVKRSSAKVNGQFRSVVTVQYAADGRELTTTCNVYGPAGERARKLEAAGQTVSVLVDPADARHVVVTDFLTIFE